jgi:hypothetical protein
MLGEGSTVAPFGKALEPLAEEKRLVQVLVDAAIGNSRRTPFARLPLDGEGFRGLQDFEASRLLKSERGMKDTVHLPFTVPFTLETVMRPTNFWGLCRGSAPTVFALPCHRDSADEHSTIFITGLQRPTVDLFVLVLSGSEHKTWRGILPDDQVQGKSGQDDVTQLAKIRRKREPLRAD